MLENWAKLTGFAAIVAAVMAVSFLWALGYVPPQNADWTCEAKPDANNPSKPALSTFTCHTTQSENLDSQAGRTQKQSDQNATDNIKITDVLLALFTAMLVIVTAVLGVVGISQGQQLKRAVDSSEEFDELLQRAYLWPGFGANEPFGIGKRLWHVTCWNSGQTAGVLQIIYWALVFENDFNAEKIEYTAFDGREDVIPPSLGGIPIQSKTSLSFTISQPMIACGWIEYEDIFGHTQRQGWKHRLNLTPNSDSLPGCYSRASSPGKTQR